MRQLRQLVSDVPDSAKVKGMYFDSFLKMLRQRRVTLPQAGRYVNFKDYPLQDLMTMMLDATSQAYPEQRPSEALRALGRLVFPTLTQSTVGRVMFAVAGRSWRAALPLTEKSYNISVSGRVRLDWEGRNSARLELRGVWNFPESYHVGVMEGAMDYYAVRAGRVECEPLHRPCDANLHLSWLD